MAKKDDAHQVTRSLGELLDAMRTAESLGKALEKVAAELQNEEFSQSLVNSTDLNNLYEAAVALSTHHRSSVDQLQDLTSRLGLSATEVPASITETEKTYLRTLILIHTLKTVVWSKLQSYREDFAPIHDASHRGGRTRTLGTKKLANVSQQAKGRGTAVLTAVDKVNRLVLSLSGQVRPTWIPAGMVPRLLDRKEILHIDTDHPLWEELYNGTTWRREWDAGHTPHQIPDYARDPRIKEGILMVLQLQRVNEERQRLSIEDSAAFSWWEEQLATIYDALQSPQGLSCP